MASEVGGFNEKLTQGCCNAAYKRLTDIKLNTTSSLSTTFIELFPSKQSIVKVAGEDRSSTNGK